MLTAGGTSTCEASSEKFLRPSRAACHTTAAFGGAVVSNPMPKKTTSRRGIFAGNLQAFQRRVDHAYIAAASLYVQQICGGTRNAHHVAVRDEDDLGALGQRYSLVNRFQRSNADRAAGAVDHLHLLRQQFVDAVAHQRVCLAAANLHQHPGACRDAVQASDQRVCQLFVAIFVDVLHCFASMGHTIAAGVAESDLRPNSSSTTPISSRY